MKLTITIKMDNAAFEEQGPEVARILTRYAKWVEGCTFVCDARLLDVNGNHVGQAKVTK